jgi:hypothetical protein
VTNLRPRRIRRNSLESLPLIVWADARERRRYPRHVRALAARYGLTLPSAATVCELAGIGQGGMR